MAMNIRLKTARVSRGMTRLQLEKNVATTQTNSNERLLKFLQASAEQQAAIDRILDGNFSGRAEAPTGPLLMGMTAAAHYIGCSRATLWRIFRAKRLQRVELFPGSFRVRRADLDALAAGKGGAS